MISVLSHLLPLNGNKIFSMKLLRLPFILAFVYLCSIGFVGNAQELVKSNTQNTINGKKYYLHTVEKGQTLYSLSKLYNVTLTDIVAENPELNDGLKKGMVLKIPVVVNGVSTSSSPSGFSPSASSPSSLSSALGGKHKVIAGETFYSIAKQYNLTVDQLKALNPQNADGLKVNDELVVVKPAQEKANGTKPGTDKLASEKVIAEKGLTKLGAKDTNAIAVALVLPFHGSDYLEVDKEKFMAGGEELSLRTEIAIQLYQGVKMAADSLRKTGLSVQISLLDVDEGDTLQIQKTLKSQELLKANLIIGPLFGSVFTVFADFASKHHIPIVSPFIAQNKILFNNPWIVKMTPSNLAQVEKLASYINLHFNKAHKLVVNSSVMKDAPLVKAALSGVNVNAKGSVDSVLEVKGFGGLSGMLKPDVPNLIFVPSTNQSFVTEFLTRLHPLRERYQITVIGMSNWTEFENIDIEYFNNLKVHLPGLNFIDYDNGKVQMFVTKYQLQQNADAGLYCFVGYDLGNFFLPLIAKNGGNALNFMVQNHGFQPGLQLGFDFFQVNNENGIENKAITIIEYKEYKMKVAN